ncbi:MAG: formylglycine-generating enzyme family protein [Zavarzinella sp.]
MVKLFDSTETIDNFLAGEVRIFSIHPKLKMKFCWIPAGEAMLGSPESEKERHENEKEHRFTTKGFWLGKYEVMQGEWEGVMGNNPSRFSKIGNGKSTVAGLNTSRFPVENVSWNDCQEFLKKCNLQGYAIRLPHEDEWEYAYRGGKGNKQAFYWGNELKGDKANSIGEIPYGTEDTGAFLQRPSDVGSYETVAPHPWGLCDMSGNVWEWCDNFYEDGAVLVMRGGCWRNIGGDCRGARRHSQSSDNRGHGLGFRVALIPLSK